MADREKGLVARLLKQSILTVCKETVPYSQHLEIDGIVCISSEDEAKQIVIKVHELFQRSNAELKNADLSSAEFRDQQNGEPSSTSSDTYNGKMDSPKGMETRFVDHNSAREIRENGKLSIFDGVPNGLNQNGCRNSVEQRTKSQHEEMRHNLKEDISDVWSEDSENFDIVSSPDGSVASGGTEHSMGRQTLTENVATTSVITKPIVSRILQKKAIDLRKNMKKTVDVSMKIDHEENGSEDASLKNKEDNCAGNSGMDGSSPGYIYHAEMPTIVTPNVRDIECKRCGMVLEDGQAFESHNLSSHNVYTCLVCYNTFTCRNNMKRHMRLHTDLDECQDDRVTKKCPADCVNTVGSYHCNCTIPGYRSIPDSPYCEDIDECAHRKGGCQGRCVNTPGSYHCKCRKGYKLAPDKRKCRDINECQLYGNRTCKHGKCFNRHGSYMCACDKGYIQHRNRIHCVDLDECKVIPNGGCEHKCVNTLGSYRCECAKPGYVLEDGGKTCLDVNECDHDNGGCEEVCVNYWGSHECRCNITGHVLHPNGRNCTECPIHQYVDEKKKICIDCPPHSMVNNTLVIADSLQHCQCLPGFHGNPGLNMPCKDIDECLDENFGCQDVCNNTIGSVFCFCNEGYRLLDDQKNCEDIDECTEQMAGCNYTCYNTEGGFYCTCPQGYQLDYDNRSCIDVDECWLKSHNCTHLCVNTEGGWDCDCPKGFILQDDDTTCLDFDECVQAGAVYCEDKCVNTQGSYRCECPHPGYKLSWDGASCSDLNECMEGENNCEDACINILGSFRCACNSEGYMLKDDGISCDDIDECQSPDLNRCEQGCENTAGGYECKCGAGYINAGYFHCKDCPENTYRDLSSTYCMLCPANSFTNGTGKGSRSDCICQEGYHGDLGVEDECNDSDECEDDNFECEHMCYNTIGSAHCGCHDGYFLHDNNKNCTDIDECSYTRHYCADQCINMPGTYRCGCRSGFRIHYDGRYCTDVDECQEEAPCDDYCQNTWGSFHCQCLQWGYTLADDGTSCVSSETGVKCPKEIFVEVAPLVNSTKVTLPSAIWSHDWNIDPDWVKSEAAFPVGVTKVTLLSKGDGDSCTFNVNVIASCGYGTYKPESTDGSTLPCVKCDPGTYQNEIDRPFCKKCFIGTYQNQSGQSECRYCTPGSMQNQTGQSQCLQCPRGSFQDLNGQSECKQCFIGSFQNQTGQSECKFCHPGFYQNKTGQYECSPCLPGSFQSSSGQSSCNVCLPGTFQSSAGQVGCIFCPFGTYQNLTGQVKCEPCPEGTYQNDIGQTQCKECNEAAIVFSEFVKRQCLNKS